MTGRDVTNDGLKRHQPRVEWARTVLAVLRTPWPHAAGHLALGPEDCDVTPERLHPAFHGSLDWHSSVHMQWSAVRLMADSSLPADLRAELLAELDGRLTPAHGAIEAAYLRERPGYERPYGWAWAAMLAAAVEAAPYDEAARWREATRAVGDVVAEQLLAWLPRASYPVRHGVHANSAFALLLLHEAYGDLGRPDVVAAIEVKARAWFGDDIDGPVRWEPSGEDFLSPVLSEAALMQRVLEAGEFGPWLAGFLPGLGASTDPLLTVPQVGDTTDGKGAHLLGLALSRAWQLRLLAPYVAGDRGAAMLAAAERQAAAVEREIVDGDFMATHWLVSFALLAASG